MAKTFFILPPTLQYLSCYGSTAILSVFILFQCRIVFRRKNLTSYLCGKSIPALSFRRRKVFNGVLQGRVIQIILWNSVTSTFFVFTELANTMKYGGGFLYNLLFTEWLHCVSQNEVCGRGCYITLFSPSDVTAFHRISCVQVNLVVQISELILICIIWRCWQAHSWLQIWCE